MAGQTDRFGRPIPADPGYKEIINYDGEVLQMRTTLFLDETITATDDPDSDATRLHGTPPAPVFSSMVETIDSVSALRTYVVTANTYKTILRTRQYGVSVYGARNGSWDYYYDPDSTDADDGVLTFESPFYDGRFKAVRPTNGMIDALACGPAAADLGSRTKSFDPSCTQFPTITGVAIGTELFRISKLLNRAGWSGISFPSWGKYRVNGGEQVSQRIKDVGFILDGNDGATFLGPDIVGSAQAIGYYARAKDESDVQSGYQLMQGGYNSKTWEQVFQGGEIVMNAIADVVVDAAVKAVVGETAVLRIGAEPNDHGGWSASQYFAEIIEITPTTGNAANIEFWPPLPELAPTEPSGSVTRNQTHHDLVIIAEDGFQDNLEIKGFICYNVFFSGIYDRKTKIDCRWQETVLGINTTGSQNPVYNLAFEHAKGYGVGGYGIPVILQATVGVSIPTLKVNADVNAVVDQELSTRGTRIGVFDLLWTARNQASTRCIPVTSSSSCGQITIDHFLIRGGYYSIALAQNVIVNYMESYSFGTANNGVQIRADTCNRLRFNGVDYSGKRKSFQVIPLTASANHVVKVATGSGIIRFCRVFPTCAMTAIDSFTMVVNGSAIVSPSGVTSNQWNDPNEFSQAYCAAAVGYMYATLNVVTNGTLVAGTAIYVETEEFIPEITNVPSITDTSASPQIVGSGAPTLNALWVGQEYIDSAASPRKWYRAVNAGSGASDWQDLGGASLDAELAAIAGLTSAADRLPYFTGSGTASLATFTATGRSVVACADAAALTALPNVATTSLKGLQSAADKEKEDRLPVRIDLATGTNTATTYTSPTWSAGAYRRLELVMRGKSTAVSGGPSTMGLVGASGTESTTVNYVSGTTTVSAFTDATLYIGVGGASGSRFSCKLDVFIPTAEWKEIQGVSGNRDTGSTAYHITKVHHGYKQDATNAVTGITVLFSGACDYELELWGYP